MSQNLPAHHAAVQARAESGARVAVQGLALNLVLAAVKFAGGIFGHTYALIADGVESLLDVCSSVLVWVGMRVAARPPDASHPFGHGRADPLAALAVAAMFFVTAAIVAAEAVGRILHPQGKPHWATLVLLVGIIVVKLRIFLKMRREGAASNSTSLGVEAWHHWSDALTSAAAFIGIAIAVFGGPRTTGADDWAALASCVVIVVSGMMLVLRAGGEMMDSAVPAATVERVRAAAAAVPGVEALDKCRVRKSGLSHLVDIHVRVNGDLTVRAGHEIAHAVKDALLRSPLGITDVSVHVEPMR
ncbi:MAG TPA: cation diffusion facilitator family transporter [Opitutaceae bacterium]|nr:cation diffusion facilitator family transporter [Opitutaceae bacterium]